MIEPDTRHRVGKSSPLRRKAFEPIEAPKRLECQRIEVSIRHRRVGNIKYIHRKTIRAQNFIAKNAMAPCACRYFPWIRRQDASTFSSFSTKLCISDGAPVR